VVAIDVDTGVVTTLLHQANEQSWSLALDTASDCLLMVCGVKGRVVAMRLADRSVTVLSGSPRLRGEDGRAVRLGAREWPFSGPTGLCISPSVGRPDDLDVWVTDSNSDRVVRMTVPLLLS
jgi:hypothetical protein